MQFSKYIGLIETAECEQTFAAVMDPAIGQAMVLCISITPLTQCQQRCWHLYFIQRKEQNHKLITQNNRQDTR